jgi:O-antigen ligase
VAEAGLLATLMLFPLGWAGADQLGRIALVVAGVAGMIAVVQLRGLPWRGHPVVVTVLVFLVASEIAAVTSSVPESTAPASTQTLLRMLVVLLLLTSAVPEADLGLARARRAALALVAGGVLLAAVAWALWSVGHRSHWEGLVGPVHYNVMCMYLVPLISLALCFVISDRWYVWSVVAIGLIATALMTYSRIGWAALAVLCMVWFIGAPGRMRWAVAGIAGAGLLLAVAIGGLDLGRAASVVDNDELLRRQEPTVLDATVMKPLGLRDLITLNDRFTYAWAPAWGLSTERPVLGWGYGERTFEILTADTDHLLTHEHNAVLAVAVQSGLAGVAAWLAWVLALIWTAWCARTRAPDDPARWLLVAVGAAVIAEYGVQGLGEPVANGWMGILLVALSSIAVLADGVTPRWLSLGSHPEHPT